MRVITSALVLGLVSAGCAGDVDVPIAETVGATTAALDANRISYAERDITATPDGYLFWGPTGLSNQGGVLGVGVACDDEFIVCTFDLLELDTAGSFSLVASDFSPNEINRHGDAGGCVVDPVTQNGQAAIADPNGNVELLPRLPGEVSSCIIQLSDNETALVVSFDASFAETVYVARNGATYPVPFQSFELRDINGKGELAGITTTEAGERAFRFDSSSQTVTLLEPVSGDPHSWGLGINNQGEVLGYSFVFSAVERIGKWNRSDEFETAFVEGTPEFPTVSNYLVWNEKGLIVVSDDSTEGKTYLVPEPGVRLDLAELLVSGSVPPRLIAYAIDERGSFLGQSNITGTFHLFTRTR